MVIVQPAVYAKDLLQKQTSVLAEMMNSEKRVTVLVVFHSMYDI